MDSLSGQRPSLTVVERVRCLDCGELYSKPSGKGTVPDNPGCPTCSYLGWIASSVPFSGETQTSRSAGDLQQRRAVRSR